MGSWWFLQRLPRVAQVRPRRQLPHRQRAVQGGDAGVRGEDRVDDEGGGALRVAGRAHHPRAGGERVRAHGVRHGRRRQALRQLGGQDGRRHRRRRALGHVQAGRRTGPRGKFFFLKKKHFATPAVVNSVDMSAN